jgi:hypothetical protein
MSLDLPDRGSNLRTTALEARTKIITPPTYAVYNFMCYR